MTVVEQAPAVRPGGYAVDFRGTAMRVLERMGLIETVKERETRTGSITMVDADGKVVTRLPDGFTSGDLEILRGDLAEVLYGATRGSAEYLFGDSIQSMVEKAGGVEVVLASGSTRQFDVVVGADGLHSNVRALAFRGTVAVRAADGVCHRGLHAAGFSSSGQCRAVLRRARQASGMFRHAERR